MSAFGLAWRVSQHDRRTFWAGEILFVLFFVFPVGIGWVLGRAFDAVSEGDATTATSWVGALLVLEAGRMATIHAAALVWTRVWLQMQTFLRANLLAAQVTSGGPEAGQPVGSAGEAVTHFRDDAEDVARFVDGMVDVSAGLVFTALAGLVMGLTNLAAAAILIVPLVVVGVATKALDSRIKQYRAADREATAAVTGLVGDMMAAATTVKANDASGPLLDRFDALVERRRQTAVRDRVLEECLEAFSRGVADVGLALVLLVGAGALAAGTFSVGDIALFTAYLGWLGFLPRMLGRALARQKQAAVAFERMRHLVADGDARNTVTPRHLPIKRNDVRVRPAPERPARVELDRLDVVGLSAHYSSGAGIDDVSLSIGRGEFVVVTGEIGSGKSTLLRAVLGLAWQAEVTGAVRWNGDALVDRAAFLVPPNAAFLPQVPQLVSDSLAENIAFGDASPEEVRRSLALAMLADDVGAWPDREQTLIGPRGLRLSGGQRQRLAGARAVVHRPELVVLDDVSSALDVETELQLWRNLAVAGLTVLAVSHRAVAFERADRVYHLAGGRLVG